MLPAASKSPDQAPRKLDAVGNKAIADLSPIWLNG